MQDTQTRYVVGFNMPGYLPEMEPYEVQGEDAARRAIIDEMLRYADETSDEDEATELTHAAEDLNLSDVQSGWDAVIGSYAYWITPAE